MTQRQEREKALNDLIDMVSSFHRSVYARICTSVYVCVRETYCRCLLWIKSVVCEPQEETVRESRDNMEISRTYSTIGFCELTDSSISLLLCQSREDHNNYTVLMLTTVCIRAAASINSKQHTSEKFTAACVTLALFVHLDNNFLTVSIGKLVDTHYTTPPAAEPRRTNLHNKRNINTHNKLAAELATKRDKPRLPDSTLANYQQLQSRQHVFVHIPLAAGLTSTWRRFYRYISLVFRAAGG